MDLFQESKRISENLIILKKELEAQKEKMIRAVDKMTAEFKAASAQGDHSENAAFTEAKSKLSMYNVTLSNIDTRLSAISTKVDEKGYKPISLITLYSTTKLSLPNGKEFILKIYPSGVSDINKGIIAADSPLGKVLWLKEVGETVTFEHYVTGEVISYTIKDIY